MRQLEKHRILPVLISYTVSYPDMSVDSDGWDSIKVALGSFHDHFAQEKVLVVDNDKDDEAYAGKKKWLYSYPHAIVVRNQLTQAPDFWPNHHPRSNHHHGHGIDLAAAYCRRHGYDYMLYFEPDCLITGTAWFDAMWECMVDGAWMTGINPCNHSARIIHVCPSIWKVDKPPCALSFAHQPMAKDREHPSFTEMTEFIESAREWVCWDTAQRNWWIAALEGKALRAHPERQDFVHYRGGSGYAGKRGVRGHPDYKKFENYLV